MAGLPRLTKSDVHKMKLKLVLALLSFGAAVFAQELIRNQEQLEEKIIVYWTAFVEHDYMAAYGMYPASARSEISFFEWFKILGFDETRHDSSEPRLVGIEVLSITRLDHPDFSHMCEVFLRLRIESQEGVYEDHHVSNVWEMDDDGNWAPSMPVALD